MGVIYKIHNLKLNKNKGFTLIEMIVVVGVIGLTIPALFSIIFVILQQQVKVYRLQKLKNQGDLVVAKMQTDIKNNAVGIYSDTDLDDVDEICGQAVVPNSYPSDGTTIHPTNFNFKDRTGGWFKYTWAGSAGYTIIYYETSTAGSEALTIAPVHLTSFRMKCERTAKFSPPTVTFYFTIQYENPAPTRPEEIVSFTYRTSVKMKNY